MTSLRSVCAAAALAALVIVPTTMTIGIPATAHAGCVSPQVTGQHKSTNAAPCIQPGGGVKLPPPAINPGGSWNRGGGGSITIPNCGPEGRCYQPD